MAVKCAAAALMRLHGGAESTPRESFVVERHADVARFSFATGGQVCGGLGWGCIRVEKFERRESRYECTPRITAEVSEGVCT